MLALSINWFASRFIVADKTGRQIAACKLALRHHAFVHFWSCFCQNFATILVLPLKAHFKGVLWRPFKILNNQFFYVQAQKTLFGGASRVDHWSLSTRLNTLWVENSGYLKILRMEHLLVNFFGNFKKFGTLGFRINVPCPLNYRYRSRRVDRTDIFLKKCC